MPKQINTERWNKDPHNLFIVDSHKSNFYSDLGWIIIYPLLSIVVNLLYAVPGFSHSSVSRIVTLAALPVNT